MFANCILIFLLLLTSGCATFRQNLANNYFHDGVEAISEKRYDSATYFLNKSLEVDQNYYNAYLMLSFIGLITGNYSSSQSFAEKCLKINPDSVDCMVAYADSLQLSNHYPQAIEQYKKILEHEPSKSNLVYKDRVLPLYGLGLSYLGVNDLTRSASYFEQCRKANIEAPFSKQILAECGQMQKHVTIEMGKIASRKTSGAGKNSKPPEPAGYVPIIFQKPALPFESSTDRKPRKHADVREVEY